MRETKTVRIENRRDRWRFVCPHGHRSWEPTNHHFFCTTCARGHGKVEPAFDALRDLKTGKLYERENIELRCDNGPYDRDLDRPGDSP